MLFQKYIERHNQNPFLLGGERHPYLQNGEHLEMNISLAKGRKLTVVKKYIDLPRTKHHIPFRFKR